MEFGGEDDHVDHIHLQHQSPQKDASGVRPIHFPLKGRGFPDIRMKTPKRLLPLVEEGLIDEVISQLMSGKEATVYVVRSGDSTRCAKVYKDAKQRSFPPGRLVSRRPQGQEQPRSARDGKRQPLWPRDAGTVVAERRSRRAVSSRRRRRARAATVYLH